MLKLEWIWYLTPLITWIEAGMAENIVTSFVSRLEEHLEELMNPSSYSVWLSKNTKLGGLPFSTKKYPFQEAILNDMHPNLCCIKPSQIGLSEVQIRKALAIAARNPHRNIIFTLPDIPMRKRLYQTRIQGLIETTQAFNKNNVSESKLIRSIEINQINESFVLFMPTNEGAATSQSADVVMVDEVDLSDQKMLALFNSRMQGSDWKISQRFSTPTYSGFGITADFERSDQMEYIYKCPCCNHHQIPDFNSRFITVPNLPAELHEKLEEFDEAWIDDFKIDLSEAYSHCEKCKTKLNLDDPNLREWVPTYPHRTHHRGYRVTPFCVSTLPVSYILTQLFSYRERDNLRGWYNTVLGKAYEGKDERLSLSDIKACFTPMMHAIPYEEGYDYFIGIDVGSICHISVCRSNDDGNTHDYVLFETVKGKKVKKRALQLLEEYKISAGHIDRYPETIMADDLRDESEMVIMPLAYSNTKGGKNFDYKEDEFKDISYAQVQRTWHLDLLVTAIRNTEITMSGYGAQKEIITEHLRDMVRKTKDESIPIWEKLTGNDHYFHSMGYAFQASHQHYGGKGLANSVGTTLYLGGIDQKANISDIGNLIGGTNRHRSGYNGGNII
jgi:hypothetical protein